MLAALMIWGLVSLNSCKNDEIPTGPEQPETVYSTLKEALQSIDHITLIRENPDTAAMEAKERGELDYKEQYSMLFLQDLNHDDEAGDSFLQKIYILFRGFDKPTILVTWGYSGNRFGDVADLATNLDANMVCVEHRNYGDSYNKDNGQWKYQTVAQASADLHAVYETLKPILKGKWLSAGTSKSGETSIDYAYFYPQDMDLAVAFCAPFVQGLDDKRFGEYLFNESGTEEERNLMKTAIRIGLQNGEEGLYKTICEQMEAEDKKKLEFTEYVMDLFDTFFQVFQYMRPNAARKNHLEAMATIEDSLVVHLCETIDGNKDEMFRTYYVECALEMGWQNDGYEYFSDLLEGTSFDPSDVLRQFIMKEDIWTVDKYDGTLYNDIVNNFFLNTTCPLLLFYSKDDPWSAGQPSVVGPNVKKVINPIGTHSPSLNDPNLCPEETKQEVMDYVTKFIY